MPAIIEKTGEAKKMKTTNYLRERGCVSITIGGDDTITDAVQLKSVEDALYLWSCCDEAVQAFNEYDKMHDGD